MNHPNRPSAKLRLHLLLSKDNDTYHRTTLPAALSDIQFEYKYDIASFFENFKFISVSAFARYAGINPSLMRQYKKRLAFASESQKAKIEEAIHKAGFELMSVRL